MRALGAAYDAIIAGRETRGEWHVHLNAVDVTAYLASIEVNRSLRGPNSATLVLHSPAGEFDPVSGALAASVAPGATAEIDLGEVGIAGSPWRVMTGGVYAATPKYDEETATIEVEVLDGIGADSAQDLWRYFMTSPQYYGPGVTPTYYTAHEIIRELLEEFAGFVWPGDFNLNPASDWTLDRPVQFQQEALITACANCVAPVGYRFYFNYAGQAETALLIPAGAPGTWAVSGTILDENIDAPLGGPNMREPTATRIQVKGGTFGETMIVIGEPTVYAESWYGFDDTIPTGQPFVGGGDCFAVGGGVNIYHWHYHLQGPARKLIRDDASFIEIFYSVGGPAQMAVEPFIVTEWWEPTLERQRVSVDFLQNPGTHVAFVFHIWGFPYEYTNHRIFSQDFEVLTRANWLERRKTIDNPLILDWNAGDLVGTQEQTMATLSEYRASVTLNRLDLRIEPGDVWTVENPKGGNFGLWVRSVSHSTVPRMGQTQIEGYVIQ